jgi:hypothetical protein
MYDDEFFTYPELKPSLLRLLQQNATSAAAAATATARNVTAGRRLHSRAQTSLGFHRDVIATATNDVSADSRSGGSGSNIG